MDETVARNILALAKAIDPIVGRLYEEGEKIEDACLKRKFRQAVDELMGLTARELIFPVEKPFPHMTGA